MLQEASWIQGSSESTGCAEAVPQGRRQLLFVRPSLCAARSSVFHPGLLVTFPEEPLYTYSSPLNFSVFWDRAGP